MIIVDSQQKLANFVESLSLEQVGVVKMDAVALEVATPVTDDLTIIHADVYTQQNPKLQSKLEEFTTVILFDENNSVQNFYPNTIAVINADTPSSIIKNLILTVEDSLRERSVLRSQLISVNQELSEIMGNVEVEMMRVKKMYEQKAPRRFQEIKGVQVFSKYAAGENIGGEFFDIFMDQNKLFVLMSATSSYLASSSILQLFTSFKMKKEISEDAEKNLINEIKAEVEELNRSKKKEISMDLFTAILDLNKHTVSGHLFGKFKTLSSATNNFSNSGPNLLKEDIESGTFSRAIERGERILLCSPGFVKNWEKLNPEFMMEEIILNKKIKPLDILDEIFFQLKKESTSGFLSYDASAIILEVQKNAMVEV